MLQHQKDCKVFFKLDKLPSYAVEFYLLSFYVNDAKIYNSLKV